MPLDFKEITNYTNKNPDYPHLIVKNIIYKNQNNNYRLFSEERLKIDAYDFVEYIWGKTRNESIRFLKSSFVYIYLKNVKTKKEKTIIYSIDCTPRRNWFLENNIMDGFEPENYNILIKQSNTIDELFMCRFNLTFLQTKQILEKKLKIKFFFFIDRVSQADNLLCFESNLQIYSLLLSFNPVLMLKPHMLGVIRYTKSIGELINMNVNEYYVKAETNEGFVIDIMHSVIDNNYVEVCEEELRGVNTLIKIRFHMYYKEFEKEIISENCVICMDKVSTQYLTNCGHVCICKECKKNLEDPVKCPLCRKINRIIINKNDK